MGRNSHYFKNKAARQKHAVEFTEKMRNNFPDAIKYSVERSDCMMNDRVPKFEMILNEGVNLGKGRAGLSRPYDTGFYVEDTDTVTALYDMNLILNRGESRSNPCVLNFASFKNPGGMFLKGSGAQEECLCHESTLYCVLSDKSIKEEYYKYNRLHTNAHLYESNSLMTPNILFYRENDDGKAKIEYADVLTIAAPNAYAAHNFATVTNKAIRKALIERIFAVLYHMYLNHNDVLILGAYGCGVFGNDPFEVAYIFNSLLETRFEGLFSAVIFAVPKDRNEENYEAFEAVIGDPNYTGKLDEIDKHKEKYYNSRKQ